LNSGLLCLVEKSIMKHWMKLTTVGLLGVMTTSCSTSYDSYGNARQSIDPAGAALGAVALGALAYSIGHNRGERAERRRFVRDTRFVQPVRGYGYGRGGRFCH
jgi:fluoride ion exporter CrcB/FEX